MTTKEMDKRILNKLDELSKEVVRLSTLVEFQIKGHTQNKREIEENRKRVRSLENTRWLMIGGCTMISFLIPYITNFIKISY